MRRCPKCGNMESESSRFCSVCGTKMEGAARQNPFRSDDEPTVVLSSDRLRSDQADNTGNPRAYTEAEKTSHAESSFDRSEKEERKRGGKGKYIAVIIVLAVLIIAAAAVFISTLTGMNGSDEEVQSGSVVQSDSDLTDIFTEESENADDDESELIEAEEEENEDSEDDAADEEEEASESNTASAEIVDDDQEAEEDADEEDTEVSSAITSDSTDSDEADSVSGKTYDGVAITTDYVLANSSSAYVKESDLVGLSAQELKIARNEIYARHGRMFNDSDLQAYFDSCSWYTGTISPDDFDTDVLNQYELENLSVIRAYETEMGYN